MDIITGYLGEPHVTSEQDRDINIGIVGDGSYVMPTGQRIAAEVSNNNEIRIRDGLIIHQGCAASIKKNTYDSVNIINGSQGMKRIDLIVARYQREAETDKETISLVVIQGTPAESDPVVPEHTEGDIQAGDSVADMPLYQVTIDGLNITEVKKVFEEITSLKELNSKFPIITSLGTYQYGVIDLHDAKIIYGVYPLHAFITDTNSGGYKADIDLSDYGFTGEMWASVTPRYPNGHPYVSIASVSASKMTILSDVNVSGAYAQWSVIGKTN